MKTMRTTPTKKTTTATMATEDKECEAGPDDDDVGKSAAVMKTMNTAKTSGGRFSTRRKNC